MDRPLWSGSLAFGIVTIPVRLLSAVRSHDLHFHQISRRERTRIRYKKVAVGSDDEVPVEDIVKGYEVEPGQYVIFEDQELAQLAQRKSRVIDITAFVAFGDIDPLLFDQPYRLVPDEQAGKPYRLLAETLARTARVGIAQMVMHGKEHLVAIRSLEGQLILHTLRYHDELVTPPPEEHPGHAAKLSSRELAMAEQLVETMADDFHPEDFHDDYRDRLRTAIERKAKGKTLEIAEAEDDRGGGKIISLVEALERSLAKQGGDGRRPPPAKNLAKSLAKSPPPYRRRAM